MNKAEKKFSSNVNKQVAEAEKQESEAFKQAKSQLGEAKAIELYDSIKSQELANQILKNKSLLYGSSIEKYKNKVDELGEKGEKISKEYKDKKAKILASNDLTKNGKNKQIEALFKEYREKENAIIQEQQQIIIDHHQNRYKVANETLEALEKESSINDFNEKDMIYIVYTLDHGNEEHLLSMLEEYDFNPFLINMVNARDSKQPTRIVRKGVDPLSPNASEKNPNKLFIEHPLKSLMQGTRGAISSGLTTKYGSRTLEELIPADNVASVDPWANPSNVASVDPWTTANK